MHHFIKPRNSFNQGTSKNIEGDENSILNSFYQERRSRSNQIKQHTLLRKNISFFNQCPLNDPLKDNRKQNISSTVNKSSIERESFADSRKTIDSKYMRQPKQNLNDQEKNEMKASKISNLYEQYQNQLRSKLNKKINLSQYLNELKIQNKQNDFDRTNDKWNKEDDDDALCLLKEKVEFEYSRNENINHSRLNAFNKKNINSLTTDRTDQRINTLYSHQDSNQNTIRQEDNHNILYSSELQELNDNSYPLRNNNNQSDDKQKEYKTKIDELESELEELRKERSRQLKFIDSIQKMRKMMVAGADDCSLKELWRWIKSLPQGTK